MFVYKIAAEKALLLGNEGFFLSVVSIYSLAPSINQLSTILSIKLDGNNDRKSAYLYMTFESIKVC